MAFKIKDGVRIGTTDVFNNSGTLLVNAPSATKVNNALSSGAGLTGGPFDGSAAVTIAHSNSVTAGTASEGGVTRTLASGGSFNIPSITYDAQGHVTGKGSITLTLPSAISANDGTLTLGMGTAGSTNTTITIGTGTGFSANTATNATYDLKVGPALTNLAALMTTAGAGFIKRGATADTYTIDTSVYLTGNQNITVSGDATGSGTTAITLTLANSGVAAGTYNNVTVNAKGLVTAGSNVSYLTSYSETDTLQTVTSRGATSNVATISLTANTDSTTTGTGTLVVTGGVGVGGAVNIGGNVVVGGNLTVNGTTTTVNSTVTTIDDPVITLGGDTSPASDDSKDRGVEFRWHNGTEAKVGFFGFDDSTGKFTFIPAATNSSEVFSGTKGTIDANIEWADILNKPTISDTNTTYSISAETTTGGAHLRLTGSDASTDNVKFASGTNVTVTYTDASTITISATDTDTHYTSKNIVGASSTATANAAATNGNVYINHLEQTTVTSTHSITGAGGTTVTSDASGNITITSTDTNTDTLQGISNDTATNSDFYISFVAANTGAQVGKVSDTKLKFNPSTGLLFATKASTTDVTLNSNANLTSVAPSSLSVNTATAIDTWSTSTYRSAKYLVQLAQGSKYQVSEVLVTHNGTTAYLTEYAVVESDGASPIPATITASIAGSTLSFNLMVTDASTSNVSIKLQRTLLAV